MGEKSSRTGCDSRQTVEKSVIFSLYKYQEFSIEIRVLWSKSRSSMQSHKDPTVWEASYAVWEPKKTKAGEPPSRSGTWMKRPFKVQVVIYTQPYPGASPYLLLEHEHQVLERFDLNRASNCAVSKLKVCFSVQNYTQYCSYNHLLVEIRMKIVDFSWRFGPWTS
jgi:hypothetical protein